MIFMGKNVSRLTHTAGERDEIGQPESDPLALQLHAIEDNAGNDHAD